MIDEFPRKIPIISPIPPYTHPWLRSPSQPSVLKMWHFSARVTLAPAPWPDGKRTDPNWPGNAHLQFVSSGVRVTRAGTTCLNYPWSVPKLSVCLVSISVFSWGQRVKIYNTDRGIFKTM
ncbi:hypothetical protein RRG08_035098 [Elysia crispata]|uniref:Uncharacterized protein n=1 Tax=Elysia crispata TaxID=231223 RepID=A0AAE0ZTK0_9GAST|nr:hypothetical protein RRG08_035098 [Elysia crispata]